jgi:hypothetical protein
MRTRRHTSNHSLWYLATQLALAFEFQNQLANDINVDYFPAAVGWRDGPWKRPLRLIGGI